MSNFKVPKPLAHPVYRFEETPTNQQLRETAIQAMRDILSIQWHTETDRTYQKSGCVGAKIFMYHPEKIYAGLPYSNGDKGLFQFMEFYDQETGKLLFEGDGPEFNTTLGCTCAGGVMWGWSAVCHTLTGSFVNYNMVKKYGCYPLGGLTYDETIDTFEDLHTKIVCEENGKDAVFNAYTLVQPADAVASSNDNHTMMVIAPAHVVYTSEGEIDGEESYIMIQDQWAGAKGNGNFFEFEEEGQIVHYSGRREEKYTFNRLYSKWYIPVSTAELLGTEPYQAPWVKFEGCSETWEKLLEGKLTCNYPMAVIKLILADAEGKELLLRRALINKWDVLSGKARGFALSEFSEGLAEDLAAAMEAGNAYTLRLDVTVTNGEVFIPAQVAVAK